MNKNLSMDWVDGVCISAMFGFGIGIPTFIPGLESMSSSIAIGGVLLAPAIRRYLFGPPKYKSPKEGAFYSLVSLLGLLLMFFSMGMFWLAGIAFQHSFEPKPNFRLEAIQAEKEMREKYGDLDIDIGVLVPAGTSQEEIEALEKAEQEKEEQRRKAELESDIKEREARFNENIQGRRQDGLNMSKYALLLCALGSLLIRIRYPWRQNDT